MILSVKKTEEQPKTSFREMFTCKEKKREREEQLIKREEKAKEVAMEPGDFRVTEVKFAKKHAGHVPCSREVTVTTEDTWCGGEDLAGTRRRSPSLGTGTKGRLRQPGGQQLPAGPEVCT